MKVLDIEQNTEEWEEFRKGKSGGSAFGKMFKVNDKKHTIPEDALGDRFFVMLAEKVARPMTPNDYADRVTDGTQVSWAVRGHILEPDAAAMFAEVTGKKLSDGKVWVSDYSDESYVSPDRSIISDDGKIREAVEIKCLSSPVVLEVWWKRRKKEDGTSDFWMLPDNAYRAQVVKYFLVNEDLEKVYWVLYTDLIPQLPIQILEIDRKDVDFVLKDAQGVDMHYLNELKKAEKELDKMLMV